MAEIKPEQINAILQHVRTLASDGDTQLSILGHALALACRSCSVSKRQAMHGFAECLDNADGVPMVLVPMARVQ